MMRTLVFTLLFTALLASCGTNPGREGAMSQAQMAEKLRAMEQHLAQGLDQTTIDTAMADSLVDLGMKYAAQYPEDTLSPQFLFRAADVARGIGDRGLAVSLWGKVAREYEGSRFAPEALFLMAFTLDNDLRDTARARRGYEDFLAQYPKHPLAGNASELLKILQSNKSPEELIREFQQQQ
ncbi:MAG: hypothetical protein KDC66_09015 [Phaeodactylibacter sp.]|nr:hypothetical protein [Phaeodactylibacter sp.]MCB9275038.1 hypothetical protein [Lewinellaceae bacterium]